MIKNEVAMLSSAQHFPSLLVLVQTALKSNWSVTVIYKFDEDPIKSKIAIIRTTFSLSYVKRRLNGK